MLSPYLVENRHVAVKRCRHGLFMYNRNDQFVGRGLDLYGQWCEFDIQLVRRFLAPGDTAIDVGANIGTHAIAYADMVGPTGRVHAFEPQPRNFHLLAGNVALNALENVVCHPWAVGDAKREIALPSLPQPDVPFNFGAMALLSQRLTALGYTAHWSIFPHFDPNNFYANTVNIWPNVVPSANLICVPKDATLDLSDHEPFLGENDNWRACVQRVSARKLR